MNRREMLAVAVLVGLTGAGCSVPFAPLVAHRAWENHTKDEVFDAAVRVLHGQDFMIAAADKGSGIISTDWREFVRGDKHFRLRLNLLVLVEQTTAVDLSFKSVVQRRDGTNWVQLVEREDSIDAKSYHNMTRTLDDFFMEVQRYVGPSAQVR